MEKISSRGAPLEDFFKGFALPPREKEKNIGKNRKRGSGSLLIKRVIF